jgi:iron complex transport system substrate-binding protein
MLFAVGAGDQVVAVDEFSTYPDEAPITDLSGFTPNLEALVGYEPDLVVSRCSWHSQPSAHHRAESGGRL